jgi:hypothetical protein
MFLGVPRAGQVRLWHSGANRSVGDTTAFSHDRSSVLSARSSELLDGWSVLSTKATTTQVSTLSLSGGFIDTKRSIWILSVWLSHSFSHESHTNLLLFFPSSVPEAPCFVSRLFLPLDGPECGLGIVKRVSASGVWHFVH